MASELDATPFFHAYFSKDVFCQEAAATVNRKEVAQEPMHRFKQQFSLCLQVWIN